MESALYEGSVFHARLRPRRHFLKYRLFMVAFDLGELPTLDGRLRLFSHNRFNLFGLRNADHGEGSDRPLTEQVAEKIGTTPARTLLLCMPSLLGFVFNPISVYFAYDAQGGLIAILYEVNNTFGQRHTYVAPAAGATGPVRQHAQKRLHVSPFMDMDLAYDFAVLPPGKAVRVAVKVSDGEGVMLDTAFGGERRDLTDAALLRAALAYPLMTLGAVAAIHWEALFLWAKRIGFRRRPPGPDIGWSRERP